MAEITDENAALAGHCLAVCAKIAVQEEVTRGYRIVSNCGDDAGQSVYHLHFHINGVKRMIDHLT